MQYLPPFVVHGAPDLTQQQLNDYTDAYVRLIKGLQSGSYDLPQAQRTYYLNALVSPAEPKPSQG